MSGIVFLRCADLGAVKQFYTQRVGMTVWLEQSDISILRHGNMLLGFHSAGHVDRDSLITFFYETREEVDAMHRALEELALAPPRVNERYGIYNFFATDPEGRKIEFQVFLHPVEPV